jgi:septal ring-binding cell division protein DamX
MWWQGKQADKAAEAVVVRRPTKRPVIRQTPPPPPVEPTATEATTTTVAPVVAPPPSKPAPMVITTSTAARVEQTTSGALITNAGSAKPAAAVPPATAADTARYEAMAREFAADKSGAFTVQFELVCEPASITRALREGGTNVWFTTISYRNRPCYRVFWGRYPTQQAAQNAIASIPQSLREATPVVVHIPK